MNARLPVAIAVLVAATRAVVPAGADESDASQPGLHRNLPKDPLVVVALSVEDPLASWTELLDVLGKLGDAETRERIVRAVDGLAGAAGFSLERELLDQLGPQLAFAVDLPPFDFAMLALEAGEPGIASSVLGGIGLIAEVRDAERVDRALRALLALNDGETSIEDGIVSTRIPVWIREGGDESGSEVATSLTLQYAIRDGRLAAGFSREWVLSAFETDPPELKLGAGADFARVFAQLDREALGLTYVNLPKIRDRIRNSLILTAVLEANPQTSELVDLIATEEVMSVGLGSTSVAMAGGVRTTNFGPQWLAGPLLSSGVVAALAVPALLVSDDRDGGEQTLELIRTIAVACEGFSSDTHGYPRSAGWVPVERIALYLEPVYVGNLPRVDEWENPILYWSDGATYRIMSTGRDGLMDRDWSGAIEPGSSADADGDIVYVDGRFLVIPTGLVLN